MIDGAQRPFSRLVPFRRRAESKFGSTTENAAKSGCSNSWRIAASSDGTSRKLIGAFHFRKMGFPKKKVAEDSNTGLSRKGKGFRCWETGPPAHARENRAAGAFIGMLHRQKKKAVPYLQSQESNKKVY